MDFRLSYPLDGSINQTTHYSIKDALDNQELEWISNLQQLYPFETASTLGGDVNQLRKSNIKWIWCDDKSHWVYDKLRDLSMKANDELWKFDLHTIVDAIQYTEYYEGGGHYDWHMDIGPGSINHRKISITIQLSDPTEYEGGDFEIWSGAGFESVPKERGTAVMFPSFLLHRVTPVTKGTRKSLVLWVGGATYK